MYLPSAKRLHLVYVILSLPLLPWASPSPSPSLGAKSHPVHDTDMHPHASDLPWAPALLIQEDFVIVLAVVAGRAQLYALGQMSSPSM